MRNLCTRVYKTLPAVVVAGDAVAAWPEVKTDPALQSVERRAGSVLDLIQPSDRTEEAASSLAPTEAASS